MEEDRNLIEDYRRAWTEFEQSLTALQTVAATAGEQDVEPLLLAVESARAKYSAARDRLAAQMLNGTASSGEGSGRNGSDEARIRGSARLIWEFAGKPSGAAEKNWLKAEALFRTAAANGK